MAGRDAQYGEPVGRRYMEQIVAFLPTARIKDEFASPASWHVRYQDRASIPLREMLPHQDAWLAAIQGVIDRFRIIEHSQDEE
jgi:hypothetical protein